MNSSVHLRCDKCNNDFWFEFTFGCMADGKAEINCPKCDNNIILKEAITFDNGDVGIDIIGAKRGLFLTINHNQINNP